MESMKLEDRHIFTRVKEKRVLTNKQLDDAIAEVERVNKARIEIEQNVLTCQECELPIGHEKDFGLWAKLIIYHSGTTALQFDCPSCGKRLYAVVEFKDQPSEVPF